MPSTSPPGSGAHQPLSDTLHVRVARPADAPGILRLITQNVASGELLPRTLEFVTLQADHFLVAARGGRLVGCVHLEEYAPSLAEVRSLAVDPAAQGVGV